MNIQGVEILSQKINYMPTWLGIMLLIITFFLSLILFFAWIDDYPKYFGIASCFTAALWILCLILSTRQCPTILNKPTKIEYTIEITDDNAWKELGPNYKVIEKVYEIKEIYRIEGDYVE